MDNKEFVWTDRVVYDFFHYLHNTGPLSLCDFTSELKSYKEGLQPKPEWEILEGKLGDGLTNPHKWDETGQGSCEERGCKIYKVKRLSDGEIFKVGDECVSLDNERVVKLTNFTVGEGGMTAWFGGLGRFFKNIEHAPKVVHVSLTPAQLDKLLNLLK